jgi:hypothetical protein
MKTINKIHFIFILMLLLGGTVVNAQSQGSNRERALKRFALELEQRQRHKEALLLKAKNQQMNKGTSVVPANGQSQQTISLSPVNGEPATSTGSNTTLQTKKVISRKEQ